MHPFSIDFITACNQDQDRNHGFDSRMTPSPTDSGMESDQSPSTSGSSNRDNAESLAEAIVAVDKQSSSPSEADEQDKPSHSYIALISMAILSSPEKRMLLSDIYQYIMDNFNFYNNQEKAWRNSIRHNLSLNECFIKNGRADNGKGNYWSIHPACEDDFARGDFRRRQARRRARRCIKGANYSDVSLPYRNNVGYVPMTASHIGYHPYTPSPPSSIYYPQAHAFTSLAQTTSPSTHQETLNSIYSQTTHNVAASNLFTQSAVYQRQHLQTSVPTSSALTAAAQRLLHEQTSAALAAQAFAPQHLNFQNW